MGHVILKEFFIERQVPFFVDYVKKFTDLPFLVTLREKDGAYVPDKIVTAADLGDTSENANFKTVLVDSATGRPHVPNGSMGFRYGDEGEGKWNLDLEGVDPALSLYRRIGRNRRRGAAAALRRRPGGQRGRRDPPPRRARGRAGDGGWPAAGHHRVRPDARPVRRGPRGPARRVADRLRRPGALHPGLAGGDHRRAGRDGRADRPGVRRQRRGLRRPVDDHPRRRERTTGSTRTRSTERSSR